MKEKRKGFHSPLFIQFLYHFNRDRDYYECHEVLEELWMEEGRNPLYQGLLQVAVGLYHHRNGNVNGARKLFRGALSKLEPFPEDALGIDLSRLQRQAKEYLERLERFDDAPFGLDVFTITIVDPVLDEAVEAVARRVGEGKGRQEG
ncbi:DUF309 domain-containing protein [Salinithrix halophila]|uniref:DUF309 domain-containing protein n=1 Tax=Salinithrix halophila TaxID=1485204 RepID=A0ABV8JC48_9BACL